MKLKAQVAFVTGAASQSGIGFQISHRLAMNGATVILADLEEDTLLEAVKTIRSSGGSAFPVKMDVTNKRQVISTFEKIKAKYGKVHILVNNAAVNKPTPLLEISEDEWDEIINVNLKGTFTVTQTVLPIMKEQKYGRIINISSVAGKRGGGVFGGVHYSASKAGIIGLTKAIAREVASFGITCNCLVPGFIEGTNLTKGSLSDTELEVIKVNTPIGRFGTVDDVSYAALFLATSEAGFITGEDIDINGGSHID